MADEISEKDVWSRAEVRDALERVSTEQELEAWAQVQHHQEKDILVDDRVQTQRYNPDVVQVNMTTSLSMFATTSFETFTANGPYEVDFDDHRDHYIDAHAHRAQAMRERAAKHQNKVKRRKR